jgi:hypothetical protein
MNKAVFWEIASCRLVEVFQSSRPNNEGSMDSRKVGKFLPDYTAQQLRRQPSTLSTTYPKPGVQNMRRRNSVYCHYVNF